jgi:hypothetical protein
MPMQEKKICLAYIQQADSERKKRPVLILKEMPNQDFLACGISTQLRHEIAGFDEVISPDRNNGLNQTSLIRPSNLVVLTDEELQGSIGVVSNTLYTTLLNRLSDHLKP